MDDSYTVLVLPNTREGGFGVVRIGHNTLRAISPCCGEFLSGWGNQCLGCDSEYRTGPAEMWNCRDEIAVHGSKEDLAALVNWISCITLIDKKDIEVSFS